MELVTPEAGSAAIVDSIIHSVGHNGSELGVGAEAVSTLVVE